MYVSVSFSILFIEMSLVFILYTIYPFLKSGLVYVNSSDENLYIGNSTNSPIQLITTLNVADYVGGGGESTDPEYPTDDPSSLTLGGNLSFAGMNWIVSHITSSRIFLTVASVNQRCVMYDLGDLCMDLLWSMTKAQRAALLDYTSGITSGKVWVASRRLMNGGLSYFNSNNHRSLGVDIDYWTSSMMDNVSNDAISGYNVSTSYDHSNDPPRVKDTGVISWSYIDASLYFRPSICFDISSMPKPFDLPDRSQLTLGNTIAWAGKQWIVVSNPTSTVCYLTLASIDGSSTFDNLNSMCSSWATTNLAEKQRTALRSISAGNTSGKVFVATKDQMNGGFAYFNSADRRKSTSAYWTSTVETMIFYEEPQYVDSNGNVTRGSKSDTLGFRPSVAIDMSLYS